MGWLRSSQNDFTGQLDHNKDMSVHVSACTSYDLNVY
jgi:hypothetical protein